MRTPLLAIRITHSESPALHAGQQFDTMGEFDATVRAARVDAPVGRVAFVLTWKDRAAFHGVYDLGRAETLVEHVARIARGALEDARLACLADGICLTLTRLFETALAERLAGASRPLPSLETPCRPIAL